VIRYNAAHWDWLVYLEMFVAGVAAGAYATATLLELFGRGRSPLARVAQLIPFPLMVLAGLLLTVDLARPERFWHMILQSETLRPMLKPWSPMSVGSWLVLLFPVFAFVSFVDALIGRGVFALGGWNQRQTLHGTLTGLLWAVVGSLLALAVASYSGVLLSTTNFGGWSDSPFIGALYVATAAVTGLGAVLLIGALTRQADAEDVVGLLRVGTGLICWQALVLAVFLLTLGLNGWAVFLSGISLLALLGAIVIGIVIPLVVRLAGRSLQPGTTALFAVLVLVGGFLLRYAIVIAPQASARIPGAS
jgi:protein NrfD